MTGALLLTVVGIAGVIATPLYSSWRPQQVNIRYIENLDDGTAKVTLMSPNPPEFMLRELDFTRDPQAIYPWTDTKTNNVAVAPPSGWLPPDATVVASNVESGIRTVDVVLQSPRRAHTMALFLPAKAEVRRVVLDGIELEPIKERDGYVIRLTGMNDQPVRLQITMQSDEPVDAWLIDSSTELPAPVQSLVAARPPLASPAGQGDSGVLARAVRL